MAMSKKDLQRVRKDDKQELTALEAKCAAGNASKDEYQMLTKLRRKMK